MDSIVIYLKALQVLKKNCLLLTNEKLLWRGIAFNTDFLGIEDANIIRLLVDDILNIMGQNEINSVYNLYFLKKEDNVIDRQCWSQNRSVLRKKIISLLDNENCLTDPIDAEV